MKYLLDTHTWIWANASPDQLSSSARKLLEGSLEIDLLLSAISPWEFSKLIAKGRLRITNHPRDWIEQALAMPGLSLVELSPDISYESTVLPDNFNSDPADQIIVATARSLGATIVTKDENMRQYPHVRSIWT